MSAIRATFHRVTRKTPPPYLARVNKFGKRTKDPMIIFVQSVETDGRRPAFGRAIVLSSPSNWPDFQPGSSICIDNFKAISRMELAGIPHSDASSLASIR